MTIKKAQIIGFLFSSVFGTLLHFVFEWTGNWAPIGAISAVNESIWEHLKLLVIPMLAYGVFEYFTFGKRLDSFLPVRLLSILIGMAVITAGYYTYSGILGFDVMALNIVLFELGLLAAYIFSFKSFPKEHFASPSAKSWSALGLVALLAVFIIFTYYPPHINLFLDPQTKQYGIPH